MLGNLQLAQILQVRGLCLNQARSLRRCTRFFTVSVETAMTQQADKVLLRQSVKQKLRQLTVEQMQSESKLCPLTHTVGVTSVKKRWCQKYTLAADSNSAVCRRGYCRTDSAFKLLSACNQTRNLLALR